VIDLVVPFSSSSRFYVRENGEGGSILCCIDINSAKLRDPTNIVITEIGFDSSGYQDPKERTLSEMMAPVQVERFADNEFYEWVWKFAGPTHPQHPSRKTIPVFTVKRDEWVSNGTGLKGNAGYDHVTDSATIVWNFENGFEVMEAQEEEELDPIGIPGNNQITGGGSKIFSFPSKASAFGDVKGIIGIRPDGDNLPEPRFPLPMQELEFREETKIKISDLESEIKELWGMMRNLQQSLD